METDGANKPLDEPSQVVKENLPQKHSSRANSESDSHRVAQTPHQSTSHEQVQNPPHADVDTQRPTNEGSPLIRAYASSNRLTGSPRTDDSSTTTSSVTFDENSPLSSTHLPVTALTPQPQSGSVPLTQPHPDSVDNALATTPGTPATSIPTNVSDANLWATQSPILPYPPPSFEDPPPSLQPTPDQPPTSPSEVPFKPETGYGEKASDQPPPPRSLLQDITDCPRQQSVTAQSEPPALNTLNVDRGALPSLEEADKSEPYDGTQLDLNDQCKINNAQEEKEEGEKDSNEKTSDKVETSMTAVDADTTNITPTVTHDAPTMDPDNKSLATKDKARTTEETDKTDKTDTKDWTGQTGETDSEPKTEMTGEAQTAKDAETTGDVASPVGTDVKREFKKFDSKSQSALFIELPERSSYKTDSTRMSQTLINSLTQSPNPNGPSREASVRRGVYRHSYSHLATLFATLTPSSETTAATVSKPEALEQNLLQMKQQTMLRANSRHHYIGNKASLVRYVSLSMIVDESSLNNPDFSTGLQHLSYQDAGQDGETPAEMSFHTSPNEVDRTFHCKLPTIVEPSECSSEGTNVISAKR
eukprot:GHVN01100332.1.p1 GENE.GHVN01100332.1~~GHVN01100332.1.p1  ORF type:complete len:589 (+),score=109.39 GHVN01100332.1:111-1877(+)